jgi:hypothetical protein
VSRNLSDDFEDDDGPGAPLDLEKGSPVHTGSAGSGYDSGGIDFDDDFEDGPASGDLQLDLPPSDPAALRSGKPPPPSNPSLKPQGGPGPTMSNQPPPRLSGNMAAVRPSGNVPPSPPSSRPDLTPQGMSAPPSSSRSLQAQSMAPDESGAHQGASPGAGVQMAAQPPPPPAPPTAAEVIAKYPSPPAKVTQAPMYAVRVVMRQLELRTDLESLRRRRSPDVPLYEAALRAYDARTFRLGMAITCAALLLATVLFFMPVILRFARAD